MKRKSITPQARTTGVVVEQLADEVLVYDLERDRAHCLNLAAARVWEKCDGKHSVSEIATEVGNEEVTWMAVEQLSRAGLLEENITRPAVALGPVELRIRHHFLAGLDVESDLAIDMPGHCTGPFGGVQYPFARRRER